MVISVAINVKPVLMTRRGSSTTAMTGTAAKQITAAMRPILLRRTAIFAQYKTGRMF